MKRYSLNSCYHGSCPAFTLVEVIIAIGIISIMSAIALPYVFDPERKLKEAARELMYDMCRTRSMAIRANTTCGIWFDTDNNRYVISSDSGDGTWSNSDTDISQVVVKEVNLSGYQTGVKYGHGSANRTVTGNSSFPSEDTSYSGEVLTFDSNGTCSSKMTGYGYRYVYLEFRHLTYAVGTGTTGVVRIFRWDGSSWQ